MRHDEFEHLIRASGDVLGTTDLIVIGSQAILASFDELHEAATRSVELDVLGPNGEEDADRLEGAIGELSPFHQSFGVYADGVLDTTATLPSGWRHRLVAYANENTGGVTAHCLEPNDLVVSKLVAGRPKDHEFTSALLADGLVDLGTIQERLAQTDLPVEEVERLRDVVTRLAER